MSPGTISFAGTVDVLPSRDAMAVSFGIQSWIEGGFIAAVIALNIVVGVYQDYDDEDLQLLSDHSLMALFGFFDLPASWHWRSVE
jgi:hypothetical protein